MHPMTLRSAVTLLLSLLAVFAWAEDRPVTGKKVTGYEPIDQAVLEFMDQITCQGATVAISRDGKLLYSQGYGWCDQRRKKATEPDTMMRIASITKPITAAAIKNAIRADELTYDTKAFDLIGVKPLDGKLADSRIKNITVRHLLEHRGGWDRDKATDPMFNVGKIENALSLSKTVRPVNVIEYMLTQPLQFTPGEKSVYSNFGYCVLGRVLEKVKKKPYFECIDQSIFEPLGIKDIIMGHGPSSQRDPREAYYPVRDGAFSLDIMDSHGGLIATAPALCQFLDAYWINGEPRRPGRRADWFFFGSLPGSTSLVRQRVDGYNIAVLLNGRRDTSFNEDNNDFKKAIDKALDKVSKGK